MVYVYNMYDMYILIFIYFMILSAAAIHTDLSPAAEEA